MYDNYPGGIGFSQPLHRLHRELLEATRRLISECACESGCPGCVGPIGNTGPLAKTAALRILELLIDRLAPARLSTGSTSSVDAAQISREEMTA